jgi:hypothetical protein
MPQKKRVHFVDPDTNDVFFPDMLYPSVLTSLTPSPSSSIYSFPTPPLPSTPSSSSSRYDRLPPVGTHCAFRGVHPAISCNGRIPWLHFDVTVAPSQLKDPFPQKFGKGEWFSKSSRPLAHQSPLTGLSPSPVCFDPSLLDEPVISPAMSSVVLFSDLLPWYIFVAGTSDHGVTLFDVWQSLHTSLRTPISKSEWDLMSAHTQYSVSAAFYRRLGGIRDPSSRDRQFSRGVRRLDFLLGKTDLRGIAAVPNKPGEFILYWDWAV